MPPPGDAGEREPPARGLFDDRTLVAGLPDHGQRVVDVGVLARVGTWTMAAGPSLAIAASLLNRCGASPHHHGHHVALGRRREVLVLELFLRLERGLRVVPAGRVAEHEDDLALEVQPLELVEAERTAPRCRSRRRRRAR